MHILAIIALLCFIFRLQAHNFKGYLKFYDYDREIAKKYGIYSMCIERRRYELYHVIGMLLSVAIVVAAFVDNFKLTSVFAGCCFIYALIYGIKSEKYIQEASHNEKRCVFLLKHIIDLNGAKDYEEKTTPEDATDIHFLYLCCNHDKMMLLFDLVPLLLLLSSLFVR